MAAPAAPERAVIRRTLGWILVACLCVAALTAIVAILSGDFDDTDWRVIGMSLGFAIFSATGASGMALRLRASVNLQTLGSATVALSAMSYALLILGLWNEESETTWRWFGAFALSAFAASHASVVTGARRDTDGDAVRAIATASIVLSCLDSGIGILAIAEAIEDIDEGFAQIVAVLVILLLLTTALPPIMRRLQGAPAAAAPERAGPAPPAPARAEAPAAAGERAPAPFAAEVIAAAERIEALNADPGNRAPEIRRECERLRALARSYGA